MRNTFQTLGIFCAGVVLSHAACGGSSGSAQPGGSGPGGAASSSSSGGAASSSSTSSTSSGLGGGISLSSSSSTSGSSSSGSTGGATSSSSSSGSADAGVEAGPTCSIYEAPCNGVCIPTSQDPQNCGGCGVTCTATQVCSGGACSSSCLPGLTACNGACLDLQDDSNNCGTCGTVCGKNEGCTGGQCIYTQGGTTTSVCTGNGPPIQLGTTTAGCVAQTSFTWGLCSCEDVTSTSTILIDGYDSTKGPYLPGGLGAGLGINGQLDSNGAVTVWGPMWIASPAGLQTDAIIDIKQDVEINGPISANTIIDIDGNAHVNGSILTESTLTVGGTLTVPVNDPFQGTILKNQLVYAPVTVGTPCDCAAKDLLPIASWVAAAAANNDDVAIALNPSIAVQTNSPMRIDLPCGVYYLTSIDTDATLTIAAHGNTALFIGGDVNTNAPISFVLDPTAQFDLVVGGTIRSTQQVVIGSPNYPALMRTYIGSPQGLLFDGPWQVGGNLWVGYGILDFPSSVTLYGGVFAQSFTTDGTTAIHFDRGVVNGGLCPPPPAAIPDAGAPAPPDAGSDAGTTTPPGCTSCRDCGNQACNGGACGACTSSSDCCAPLTCFGGTCLLIQ